MAIEKVYVINNTGVIVDEIIAHRLGFVPIKADASLFECRNGDKDPPTDKNTIVFRLKKIVAPRPVPHTDAPPELDKNSIPIVPGWFFF